MRTRMWIAVALLALNLTPLAGSGFAVALPAGTDTGSIPLSIGNRANGFDYQPTPAEVGPRERAAGIAPSAQQSRRIDDEVFSLDRQLLKSEGVSSGSLPSASGSR